VAGIVLAAGGSARFGAPKQLAPFRGRPLLEWPLRALLDAGLDPAIVVLGAHAERIAREADLGGARVVVCEDWASGQSASLRAGLAAAAPEAEAAVIVLGDQPLLHPEAIRRVVGASRGAAAGAVVRARYGDTPGHPTLLPRSTWGRVDALRGDEGARALLRDLDVVDVACDGLGSPADADTPEALRALADAPR
jgi:CTP:molybdopterin cytidylyltransferase MocA